MDYISRKDAIKIVRGWFSVIELNPDILVDSINALPAADVVERNATQHTQCVESVKNALDVEERKVNKISDLEFLYEEFKNVPNLVCCDCECYGAPGIMMTIPIGEKEINLYFDFYGSLCK